MESSIVDKLTLKTRILIREIKTRKRRKGIL